jgi:hypothetical protein
MYLVVGWVVSPRDAGRVRAPVPGGEIMLDRGRADEGHYFSYPLTPDGWALCREFRATRFTERQITDGVLADWLEEHKEELLAGATGPSDPAERLDQLIAYLRERFAGRK